MKREHTTLEEYVASKLKGGVGKYRVLREVWTLVNKGGLKLEDPDPPATLVEYAFRLDYSLWFWTCIALVVLTLLLVYVTGLAPILMPLRYALGTIFVLFLPGYVLVEALYPEEKSLTPLERVALSIGLSLALVPLIGLLLNYTPWGIRLGPILIALSTFTLLTLILASYRKFKSFRQRYSLGRLSKSGGR